MEKAARKSPSLGQAPLLAQSTPVARLLPPAGSPQILAQFLPEVSIKGCLKPARAKKQAGGKLGTGSTALQTLKENKNKGIFPS